MALNTSTANVRIVATLVDNVSAPGKKIGWTMYQIPAPVIQVQRVFVRLTAAMLGFGRMVLRTVTSLKALVVTLAALLAARKLVGVFSNISAEMDRTAKLARELNTSTEFLTSMEVGARFAGAAAGDLERSMRRLARVTSEAGAGNAAYSQIMRELNIQVRGTNGQLRSTDEIMGDVADALSKVQSSADRSRIAAKLFGQEAGPRMVNYLAQGRAGLEAARKEAEFYGVTLGGKAAKAAEDFADALYRLGLAFRGIRQAVVESGLETLTDLFNGLSVVIASNRDKIVKIITDLFKYIAERAIQVANLVGNIISILLDPEKIKAWVDIFMGLLKVLAIDTAQFLARVLNAGRLVVKDLVLGSESEILGMLSRILLKIVAFQQEIQRAVISGSVSAAMSAVSAFTREAEAAEKAHLENTLSVAKHVMGELEAGVKSYKESWQAVGIVIQGLTGSGIGSNMAEYLMGLGRGVRSDRPDERSPLEPPSIKTWDEFFAALDTKNEALKQQLRETTSVIGGLTKSLQLASFEMRAGIADGFRQISAEARNLRGQVSSLAVEGFGSLRSAAVSAFEGIYNGSMSAGDAMRAFGQAFINTLINMAAQLTVMIPLAILFNVLTGGALSMAGLAATASAMGGAAGLLGAFNGGGGGGGASTAGAGTSPAPAPGQELYKPSTGMQASNAVPVSAVPIQQQGGAGGNLVMVNYNINAMDAKSFSAFVNQPDQRRALAGANATQFNSDPAYRGMMQG